MSSSQLNLYNSNIKTHIIDAIYDSPNYRSIYTLPSNSVFLSNWRLAGVGQYGDNTTYNYLLGSHGVIDSIELMDGADTIIDQLHDFSLWSAFKAINNDIVGDLSVDNFLKNNSVGRLFTGTDQTDEEGIKWQQPNSKNTITANYDQTKAGWLSLSDSLNFLKNSQYVPTNIFKQCRLIINWKNASQLQQNVLASNDADYTTNPAVLIIDELVDPKRKMEIMNTWDGTEFYSIEGERLTLPAVSGLTDTAGNTEKNQTVNYQLQGFNNKYVNRLLMIRQPTDSATWVDPNNTTTNYGASNQSSFSVWKSKFQLSLNSKPVLPFSGWTRKNQMLGQLVQTWGDLAIPPGSNLIGFNNQSKYYTTTDDVIGKMDYTGIYIDDIVEDLSLQLERCGVYGSKLISAGTNVGNVNVVTSIANNATTNTNLNVTFTSDLDVYTNGKSLTFTGFVVTNYGAGGTPNGTGIATYPFSTVICAGITSGNVTPITAIYSSIDICLGANIGNVTPITEIVVAGNNLTITVAGADITDKLADNDTVMLGGITDADVFGVNDRPNGSAVVSNLAFGGGNTTFTLAGLGAGVTIGGMTYTGISMKKISTNANVGDDLLCVVGGSDITGKIVDGDVVILSGVVAQAGNANGEAIVSNTWTHGGYTQFTLPVLGENVQVGALNFGPIVLTQVEYNKITVQGLGLGGVAVAGFDGTSGKVGEAGNANDKFNQQMNLQVFGEVRKSVVKAGNDYIVAYV